MKIDLDYMADFLEVFINSEKAHVDFNDIEKSGLNVSSGKVLDEKFIFHLQLALDNQFLGSRTGLVFNLKDVGIRQSLDGTDSVSIIPIRLTQVGHDFACTLNNKEVLSKLKSEFKDAPFKVIFEGGQKLLQHAMTKKLDKLLE
jgi:hypothetical protein